MSELDLVGSDEARRLAGVPYSTFMRWVADGRIKPALVMPGISGAKLFDRADVEKLRDDIAAKAAAS